jgi:carotenoid biosynthesis protein
VTIPPVLYELVAAPLAFALAAVHARRALGTARAAVELLALVAYGYALERTAIAVFGSHEYGPAWRAAPGGVPLAVAATWAAVIVAAMALGARLTRTPLGRAAAAALIGISLDLLMEPVAVRAGLWTWTPPGPWLLVPIGNFVGWAVIVGAWTFGAERWSGAGSLAAQALRRAALGLTAVAALVAVGLVWRGLAAERAFLGAGGWLAWALTLLAACGLALRPAPAAPDSGLGLAARLGAASGSLPAAVLLLLLVVFAADARLLGDRRLMVVALGSAATLAVVARRAST